jgi:hypothetical protein
MQSKRSRDVVRDSPLLSKTEASMAKPEFFQQKARECAEMAEKAPDERDVRLLRAMEREFREKAEAASKDGPDERR